jgi:beta-lactamase class D
VEVIRLLRRLVVACEKMAAPSEADAVMSSLATSQREIVTQQREIMETYQTHIHALNEWKRGIHMRIEQFISDSNTWKTRVDAHVGRETEPQERVQ